MDVGVWVLVSSDSQVPIMIRVQFGNKLPLGVLRAAGVKVVVVVVREKIIYKYHKVIFV